jgi:hypothetical protein
MPKPTRRADALPAYSHCHGGDRQQEADPAPPAEVTRHLRHRLNYLINGKLRGIFGQ